MSDTIGIIGAGNMGEAFVGAVLKSNLFEASGVWISDVNNERLAAMKTAYGIQATNDSTALFKQCDIVVLAVKPQQMNEVLSLIATGPPGIPEQTKLIISIAAGIRLEKIEGILYAGLSPDSCARLPVIRVMPNTPSLVLQGVSGMSVNRHATAEDTEMARRILSAMGTVVLFDEDELDAVTALSGSGPAYVFYLAEAMISAGSALGLSMENARKLTLGTLKGAAALMEERGESPEELRRKVTSPGGTTEAAITVLDEKDAKATVIAAITAAAERSRKLSG
jgi:pyrroline-5-carboxylate reductase